MEWWGKYNLEDIRKTHKFSVNHKEQLLQDKKCGSFCCGRVFTSKYIVEWVEWGVVMDMNQYVLDGIIIVKFILKLR